MYVAIFIAAYLLFLFVHRVHPHRHCCLRQGCLLTHMDLEPNASQPGISLSDPPRHVSFSCHWYKQHIQLCTLSR